MALGLAERLLGGQFGLGLRAAVAAKVDDPHAAVLQHAADQQAAVAVGRILLAAKDRRAGARQPLQQPLDSLPEAGRFGQGAVQHAALLVIEARILGASAQQVAEVQILDFPLLERRMDRLAIELRGIARIGTRSHVDQQLDLMACEEIEKRLQRMIGMSDRPDRRWQPWGGIMHCRFTANMRQFLRSAKSNLWCRHPAYSGSRDGRSTKLKSIPG